ncbi:MAG TPA: GMC family oxidoreductase [Deltaproteobacteria bacterium]|nr:GMC family oxidoreductase [Deltaproteobacteria bacterium]
MKEYDVIVVGSGPGGATVAREMSRRGKKVLLTERGGRWNWLGNTLSVAMILQNAGLTVSRSFHPITQVTIANNYGGASTVMCGCAIPPPRKVFDAVGIDLSAEAEEARQELWVTTLPDELVGLANLRLMDAANDLGYHWEKLEKFIKAEKCIPECSDCMMGCNRGAKWSARFSGDDAITHGAELALNTRVDDIIVENGTCSGVKGSRNGKSFSYYGKRVVLSSGIGNVRILQRAGIQEAGRTFAVDFLQFVGGVSPYLNTSKAQPMAVGTLEHYETDGIVVLPVFPTWSQLAVLLAMKGVQHLPKARNAFRYTGLMVKIQDDLDGTIHPGNRFFPFTKIPSRNDRLKLAKGADIMKRVLRKVGVSEASIVELNPSGAHPCATCRIGDVVDTKLETSIKNLYCCDASVVPASLGLPVVWTIVALGKRLAKHLETTMM